MSPRSYPCLLTIYLLRNNVDEEIYAGSTINLQKRLQCHKSAAKTHCKKGCKLYDHINKIGWDHFYAESLYEFNCKDAEYAGQSEDIAIECFGSLNTCKAYRTLEEVKAYKKAHQASLKGKQNHREGDNRYRSDPNRGGKLIACPCSKRLYKKHNFKQHCRSKKHRRYQESVVAV